VSEVSEATFYRVLLYAGHPNISTDRGKYSATDCSSEKEATMTSRIMSPIEETNIVPWNFSEIDLVAAYRTLLQLFLLLPFGDRFEIFFFFFFYYFDCFNNFLQYL